MRRDYWAEGTYVDLWSIVHMLSGFAFGIFVMLCGGGFVLGFVLITILAILWEAFEIKQRIHEPKQNRIVDVLLAQGMFVFSYYMFAIVFYQNIVVAQRTFLFTLLLLGILNLLGWRARHKRIKNQGNH